MQLPMQIVFRNMARSEALEARIHKEAEKIERFFDRITSCRVVVEAAHKHHQQGNLYHVRIDVTVPNGELVASRQPHDNQAHEDAYVAVRDAFNAMRRQLDAHGQRIRREVKAHEGPPLGRVSVLHPEHDYGIIQTLDGREIYFHRNSVLESGFEGLTVGSEVRFNEEQGEEGPQASSVHVMGR